MSVLNYFYVMIVGQSSFSFALSQITAFLLQFCALHTLFLFCTEEFYLSLPSCLSLVTLLDSLYSLCLSLSLALSVYLFISFFFLPPYFCPSLSLSLSLSVSFFSLTLSLSLIGVLNKFLLASPLLRSVALLQQCFLIILRVGVKEKAWRREKYTRAHLPLD